MKIFHYYIDVGEGFERRGNLCQNIEIFPPELVLHPCYYFRSDILTRRTSKLPLQSQQARRSYEQSQPSPFSTPVLPQKHVPLPLPLASSPLPQQDERIYAQPILSQVCSMLHVFSFIGSYCRYLNIKLVMLEE